MSPNVIIELRLNDMPTVLAALRHQMAEMLRTVALDEEPRTAARLHEIAMAFEIGAEDTDG